MVYVICAFLATYSYCDTSPSYVTPIEDTVIQTPALKDLVWVQPMGTYPCIGKSDSGYLVIYSDTKGMKRIGTIPWRDRMSNITVDENKEGNTVTIRAGAVALIGQGAIILQKGTPYQLVGNENNQSKVRYFSGSFTQEVLTAKDKLLPASLPPPKTNNATSISTEGSVTKDTPSRSNRTNSLTITTTSGVIYSDCIIMRVEPDGISVSYSKGIIKIPFPDLSESYRNKFGYDPEKAKVYQEQKVIAQQMKQAGQSSSESDTSSAIRFSGQIIQVLNSGCLLLSLDALYSPSPYMPREPIFVEGLGQGRSDGTSWEGWLAPNGTYQYIANGDIQKTVKCYRLLSAESVRELNHRNEISESRRRKIQDRARYNFK